MATQKFKALVHYIVASCDDPRRLGATKLNKVLWFSDTLAYKAHGSSISSETYVRRQRGPVPKSILFALRELVAEGKIHIREVEAYGFTTRLFTPLADPDLSMLSESDRFIVDAVMQDICSNHTARSISELSHDKIWDAANEGEEIPMFATLAAEDGEITDEVTHWADGVIERMDSQHQAA